MKKIYKNLTRVTSFILICLLAGQSVFATTAKAKPLVQKTMIQTVEKLRSKTIMVGTVEKGESTFAIGDVNIPTYICKNISYILLGDLKKLGVRVTWDPETGKTVIYDFNPLESKEAAFNSLGEHSLGYLGRDFIYINNQEVPGIFVDGQALVPAKWIPAVFTDATVEAAEEEKEEEAEEEEEEETAAEAETEGINIWFDGEHYIEVPYVFSEDSPEKFEFYKDDRYDQSPEFSYVGFVITKEKGIPNQHAEDHIAWLRNPVYYSVPEGISEEVLKNIFPDTRVKGLMKYAAGGFAKGEEVSVLQASTGSAYYLAGKTGKRITVPWSSVSIKPSPVTKEEASQKQIEEYVNTKDFSSKTKYFVWTDLYRQRTYVFEGSKNNWQLIKTMLSSSGKDTSLTPTGSYTLNVRVPYFGTDKGYRVKNAYGFIGTSYLYHSVVFDKTGTYLLPGWGNLGNKASSGCIRLSEEDSLWLYKTMPIGTSILIN